MREHGLAAAADRVIDLIYTHDFQRDRPDAVEEFRSMLTAYEVEDILGKLHATAAFDHTTHLTQLEISVLVIAGEHDGVFPSAHSEHLAATIPHAELVVFRDSGHQPHVDAPAAFNEVLRGFLADHPCSRFSNEGRR
ncbi:alpha/beta fold hydrolase [Nocardia brasiliensis]|uniref:alpha/beta fold hydrolase n=1 Tax=Nocardia brasiliensis TaxID=37326 RepID=UPI003D8A432B